MGQEFTWDPVKERENLAKHAVDFATAARAFDDPGVVLAEDAAHSGAEPRWFAFGLVDGSVLTVRFTVRVDTIRIIGAGYWRKGRDFYEEANRLHR